MFTPIRSVIGSAKAIALDLQEFGIRQTAHNCLHNVRMDVREGFQKHFQFSRHGTLPGLFLRLPFTRLSLWLEWRQESVGLGLTRSRGAAEFFLGRLQGVACIEPINHNAAIEIAGRSDAR